jgi:hypothetical protein
MMKLPELETRSGETILCQLHPNRSWYALAWRIIGWLLLIALLTFFSYSYFYQPLAAFLSGLLTPKFALVCVQVLCLGVVPLFITAWAVEDVACMFTGNFILTDQRLYMRGLPFAWSRGEIPLEDIASMTSRKDAVFIRQKSVSRLRVLMVSDGKLLVNAFDKIVVR